MPRVRWSKEELNFLLRIAGEFPLPILVEKLNNWHERKQDGICRTKRSVWEKLHKNNYSPQPMMDDHMTQQEWGKQLGLRTSVHEWVRRGYLPVKRINRSLTIISKSQMKRLLINRPYLFKKVDQEIIVYYFGDDSLKLVKESVSPPGCNVGKIPVIRKDTGKVYPSIYQASKDLNMHKQSVKIELSKENGWLRYAW
jgi:hypothetical protein